MVVTLENVSFLVKQIREALNRKPYLTINEIHRQVQILYREQDLNPIWDPSQEQVFFALFVLVEAGIVDRDDSDPSHTRYDLHEDESRDV